ncbi:MAG: endonuclease/helicase [Phage AS32]|nr:MAG: endonuclease/helicase [Phage AS32]
MSSAPADVGTSVHYALEHFVKDVYLEEKYGWDQIQHLNAFYQIGYVETFNTTNFDTDEYRDGANLVAKWYNENKEGLPNKVLSCELKENFLIKTSAGMIPFNFIWDRADQRDEDVYEIVDYKTLRAPVKPEDLKKKIQPRAYALAAQIKWPQAKRIWVTFDMLRYGPVGTVFTRDENADTYRYLQRAAERIIAVDEDETQETLNEECKWCIRKSVCDTLLRANTGGNPMGLSLEALAERKMEISSQLQALSYAEQEVEKLLVQAAEELNEFEFEAGDYTVTMSASSRRQVNGDAVAAIVGPEMARKYGNFTVTSVDKMIESGELSPEKVEEVRAYITKSWSSPRPKVKKKVDFS